jgi:hypothetical protein
MMFRSLAVALLAASASAFVPATVVSQKQRSSSMQVLSAAALQPPPLSPLTSWGDRISDIRQAQQALRDRDMPEFATTVSAVQDCGMAADDTAAQLIYVREHAMELKQKMQDHGAVIFRDFDLMKTSEGFQEFYAALGMKVCLDPLHSVSARPTVDGQKNSPVYEAVNKESRKNFFIGTYVSYVCMAFALSRAGGGNGISRFHSCNSFKLAHQPAQYFPDDSILYRHAQ